MQVGLHWDWAEALSDPELWPYAENIHIYTTAHDAEVQQWIEGLESDGAIKGWAYGKHSASPEPLAGYQVYSVFWD